MSERSTTRMSRIPTDRPISSEAPPGTSAFVQLRDSGFAVLSGILAPAECDRVARHLEQLVEGRAGSRTLLSEDWCRELATMIARHAKIAPLLSEEAVPFQCTLFEKSPENNWLVALHQDQSIPVAERIDAAGCSGWSEKDGLTFVQPPADVLSQFLAVRLQVDAPEGSDGALRVIPGSHRNGKLTLGEVAGLRTERSEVGCKVEQGGVLVMRPLLLHASSKLAGLRPRRVLHFLFGPPRLPHGLRVPECRTGKGEG